MLETTSQNHSEGKNNQDYLHNTVLVTYSTHKALHTVLHFFINTICGHLKCDVTRSRLWLGGPVKGSYPMVGRAVPNLVLQGCCVLSIASDTEPMSWVGLSCRNAAAIQSGCMDDERGAGVPRAKHPCPDLVRNMQMGFN